MVEDDGRIRQTAGTVEGAGECHEVCQTMHRPFLRLAHLVNLPEKLALRPSLVRLWSPLRLQAWVCVFITCRTKGQNVSREA